MTNRASYLKQGNTALREKHYEQAIGLFTRALRQTPQLGNTIAANIATAKRRRAASALSRQSKLRVAVSGWALGHESTDRICTLAQLHAEYAHVEIIGSLFPTHGGRELWKPLRDAAFPVHSFIVDDLEGFLDQALDLVSAHPYDTVHLSNPRAPNILIGILYKLLWDAQVLVDIADEELCLTDAACNTNLDDCLRAHEGLPPLSALDGLHRTQIAMGMINDFDGLTVATPSIQQHCGGALILPIRTDKIASKQLGDMSGNTKRLRQLIDTCPVKPLSSSGLRLASALPSGLHNLTNVLLALSNISEAPSYDLIRPANLEPYYFDLIKQSGLFDAAWYLKNYKSRLNIKSNALAHYLTFGVKYGLNPSEAFDTKYYIDSNPDLNNSELHPFIHYVAQGRNEGRKALPPPPPEYVSRYAVSEPKYVPRLAVDAQPIEKAVKVICFYLPQFHAIPENDEWWGKGFTEWTNVKPAKPQFEGHYQPHIPDDFLGYYSLLDHQIQAKQVELAKQYGIYGFCFYYYWFSGKRLLELPLDNYLRNTNLDLPYCLCWANENWTRRWDGLDHDILIKQDYSPEDDIDFITNISKHFKDPRYIRIDDKPLLLIYRPNLFPDIKETVRRWRNWCKSNGIGDIYLVYPQSFETVNPLIYGFDAATEFPPVSSGITDITSSARPIADNFQSNIYDWKDLAIRSENYQEPDYKLFRALCPGWDNTARKRNKGSVLVNNTPANYQKWLVNAIQDTLKRFANTDERLIFVNAWNEWAEGAHLEPDQRTGYAYLEATRQALVIADICNRSSAPHQFRLAIIIHAYYPDVFSEILRKIPSNLQRLSKLFITTNDTQHKEIVNIASCQLIPYEIHIVNNRGRDMLPFLKITGHVRKQGYEYILKLHTKKSLHRADGDIWRNDIYDKLLDSKLTYNLEAFFLANDKIGLIAPDGYIVPLSYYWGCNKDNVLYLAGRLGLDELALERHKFIAGTMFYARLKALEPLLSLAIPDEAFEVEQGQVDGTMAHAIERAFVLSANSVGFFVTATTDMLDHQPQTTHMNVCISNFYKPETNRTLG